MYRLALGFFNRSSSCTGFQFGGAVRIATGGVLLTFLGCPTLLGQSTATVGPPDMSHPLTVSLAASGTTCGVPFSYSYVTVYTSPGFPAYTWGQHHLELVKLPGGGWKPAAGSYPSSYNTNTSTQSGSDAVQDNELLSAGGILTVTITDTGTGVITLSDGFIGGYSSLTTSVGTLDLNTGSWTAEVTYSNTGPSLCGGANLTGSGGNTQTATATLPISLTPEVSCASIINNSIPVNPNLSGGSALSGFTKIQSTFTPNNGYLVSEAAQLCGFADFDWIQTWITLPDPSPFSAYNLAVTSTTGVVGGYLIPLHLGGSFDASIAGPVHLTGKSVQFNDPPQGGGYTYDPLDYSYPFYCDPTGDTACPRGPYTLSFGDAPCNYCISNASGTPSLAYLSGTTVYSAAQVQAMCGNSITKAGAAMAFTTYLAGVNFDGTAHNTGIGYTWTSNFNGTSGGIATTKNGGSADPGSGTGGITIVNVNQTTTYQYPNSSGQSSLTSLTGNQISTTASGLAYSRVSQTFNGTVTITNISNSPIAGPLQIVLNLLTTGVVLANATSNFGGWPYVTVPTVGSLAPGQSFSATVQFKNPSNSIISFTPQIYSGSFN